MAENQYRCEECGETFDNQPELEQHYRTVHSRFTCEICGETFDSETEFEAHSRITHPDAQRSG